MNSQEPLRSTIESYLADLIVEVADIPVASIDALAPFGEIGIDSFRVLRIIKRLEQDFGPLPKTLLFEHYTVAALADYFTGHRMAELHGILSTGVTDQSLAVKEETASASPIISTAPGRLPTCATIESWTGPILLPEQEVAEYPALASLVSGLFAQYKNEGSVSRGTRCIAPYLFIGSTRQGYFHYCRSNRLVLVYSYTGPEDYLPEIGQEFVEHCQRAELNFYLFSGHPLTAIGAHEFTATQFGVVQRVEHIDTFSLDGQKMRRLRYQVAKFEKTGLAKTEEYLCGTSSDTDQAIAAMIDTWSAERAMVNPLIPVLKAEIVAGRMSGDHRLFLTYLDDKLENVILITPLANNGYLMDLEFYSRQMPLGGLEYAIVQIIAILSDEGHTLFSLGGTYGCRLEGANAPNTDLAIEQALEELHRQNIFNDEGNLQFKNKFRPANSPIYLCRKAGSGAPSDVIDIIMMIADPERMQTPDDEHFTRFAPLASAVAPSVPAGGAAGFQGQATAAQVLVPGESDDPVHERELILRQVDFNALQISTEQAWIDLRTDSWAHHAAPQVLRRMALLRENLQNVPDLNRSLKALFPFQHITVTGSCRLAERCFFRAFPGKGVVLQNPLFPTTIFHQIDNGFMPLEIPHAEVHKNTSVFRFKAGLDMDALQDWLLNRRDEVALLYLELCNNALGGQALSLKQLRAIKGMTREYGVPLVLDATRILENARFIAQHELHDDAADILAVARDILAQADVVLASLAKDFGIGFGGIVATRDTALHSRIQAVVDEDGSGVDVIDKKLIALALSGKKYFCQASAVRMRQVERLHQALRQLAIPLLEPAGGHCVVVDLKHMPPFSGFASPAASFVAWVYRNTGILCGVHNSGLQNIAALKETARLALPLGMSEEQVDQVIQQFTHLLREQAHIPQLQPLPVALQQAEQGTRYELVAVHNNQGTPQVPASEAPSPHADVHVRDTLTTKPAAAAIPQQHRLPDGQHDAIAIVGLAGRYPQASNVAALWRNLVAGADCIEEIPLERQQLRQQIRPQPVYRGGFIAGIDRFDALFFSVSPREAETMDPQERHFLEVAWETIEDAGYCPDQLEAEQQGGRVGVFVGAVWTHYQMAGSEARLGNQEAVASSFLWSVANRVSYHLNFTGPSLAVDTACSSSLTALHLACEALQRGECRVALVGGVNLDIHEAKFQMTQAGGALSPDGVCRSFGQGANGYVAGEGIGAVLLKPLQQALADHDNIYALIKGSAINHGGKTSGYAVPSPVAQGNLIAAAMKAADVEPATIDYIEAHGTGTALGDPVEIAGLSKAFAAAQRQTPVAIGSIKTNIGHLEAAAGIAGITKVVLQMQHRQLVPSLHSTALNELIETPDFAFQVPQELQAWPSNHGSGSVLRAGVSSFGAGGANAHVILESFQAMRTAVPDSGGYIIPLSARSEQQVLQSAAALHEKLIKERETSLEDLAFTLQRGRKSFEFRAALVVSSIDMLLDKLERLVNGTRDDAVLVGQVRGNDTLTQHLDQNEKRELVNLLSQSADQKRFARLWVDGVFNDCSPFRDHLQGHRISLPTYPFADKRHWIPRPDILHQAAAPRGTCLHPLLDSNESTFERQLFSKHFSAQDFVIQDHLVSNVPTLPGVAYLELARKAGELAAGHSVRKIRNILWVSPLAVAAGSSTQAFIELTPTGDSVAFEVFGNDKLKGKILFSQGKLTYAAAEELAEAPEYLDIEAIKTRCHRVTSGSASYPVFKSLGLDLGPGFQVVHEVYRNDSEVLGELILPPHRHADLPALMLHPSLMDGAFQAAMAARIGDKVGEMFVPYSIGEIEILAPLETHCFTYVVAAPDSGRGKSKVSRMNVFVLNAQGRILVKVKDSVGVPLVDVHDKPKQHTATDSEFDTLYYAPKWLPAIAPPTVAPVPGPLLVFAHDAEHARVVFAPVGATHAILVVPGTEFAQHDDSHFTVNPDQGDDFRQLLARLHSQNIDPDGILFAWPDHYLSESSTSLQAPFVNAALAHGVYALLHLCQALAERKSNRNTRLLCVYRQNGTTPEPHNQATSAFLRSVNLEYAKLESKVLLLDSSISDTEFTAHVHAEFAAWDKAEHLVRFVAGERFCNRLTLVSRVTEASNEPLPLKHRGVYLITGGAGGLGYLFARHLAECCSARLVLIGRSPLNDAIEDKLAQLRSIGGEACYYAVDIADQDAVAALVNESKNHYGALSGVIHSAGVLRDAYLKNKTAQQLRDVFTAKVFGTLALDQATQDEPLDFLVLFSSLAGIGGNAGQSDYAYANQFMDVFAERRQGQVRQGQRNGKSLSINWSLWADGGMKMDEQSELFFRKNLGIKSLDSPVGTAALTHALAYTGSQLAVLEAVQHKIERAWGIAEPEEVVATQPTVAVEQSRVPSVVAVQPPNNNAPGTSAEAGQLAKMVSDNLVGIAADFLKMEPAEVALDTILLELGFDSIGLTTYANAINTRYGTDVTPVLFFEYPSIREISTYLATDHADQVRAYHTAEQSHGPTAGSVAEVAVQADTSAENDVVVRSKKAGIASVLSATAAAQVAAPRSEMADIAIVGISGVMPNAANLDAYWSNLEQGTSMISEIPRDRWRWEEYFGDPKTQTNRTDCKWGGFMPEVDKFDAEFFGISAREAKSMDPQQRLFLETAWQAVEDAGHRIADLAGTRTGVFVGVGTHDYTELMSAHQVTVDGYISTGNSHAVLVNRVSYLLGLTGPSAAIDTACSSSLVALHRAVESIRAGSSDMALVGGVQVMLTPAGFIAFGDAGMLSNDGLVRTFDKDANGYLRGEGVGAIFLKPLTQALEDRNPVYAVIRASAENHGGRATALTAPNPAAQVKLLQEAYDKAGIDPNSIGYMECHGTATSIGDSIEIQSLKKVFSASSKRNTAAQPTQHCGLSSVKSSIGHLEAAAGISAILKAVLALKHRKIPASLNFNNLNPYIDLRDTPFYVVDQTRPWDAPLNADGKPLARRVGINSFGFGGSNAHVVLEQYDSDVTASATEDSSRPEVVLLSARNIDSLVQYTTRLREHVLAQRPALRDIAYTLRVGRDLMPVRFGCCVSSLDELLDTLAGFIAGQRTSATVYWSQEKLNRETVQLFNSDDDLQDAIEKWMQSGKHSKLLELWTRGVDIDWTRLPASDEARRLSLPTYPFARHRHWFDLQESDSAVFESAARPRVALPLETTKPATALWEFGRHIVNKGTMARTEKMDLFLAQEIATQTGKPADTLERQANFIELGASSLGIAQLIGNVNALLDTALSPSILFEFPTITLFADHLAQSHPAKVDSVGIDKVGNGTAAQQPAEYATETAHAPQADNVPACALSEGQKALYVMQKLHPERVAYNMPLCFRTNAKLDLQALRAACAELSLAFPILSARVCDKGGALQLRENPTRQLQLQNVADHTVPEAALADYLAARIAEPFDIEQGPLLRAQYLRCENGDYVVLLTIHHLVFDGMSIPILLQHLLTRYAAHHGSPPLPPLPVSRAFYQFVAWEQELLASPQGETHACFWRERLRGELPNMQFTAFRADTHTTMDVQARHGATKTWRLSPERSRWLTEFAAQQALQPSVLFLALFQLLVGKITGQQEAVVVMPVATRYSKEALTDIGYYFNIVPIRTELAPTLSLQELFSKVQGSMLDAVYHAAYPSSLILAANESRKADTIFHTFFAYQNIISHVHDNALPMQQTLDLRFVECTPPPGDFGLSCEVFEDGACYTVQVQSDPDRYKASLNTLVVEAFEALLEEVAQDTERSLEAYSICGTSSRQYVVHGVNDTAAEFPQDRCMHQLFLESAHAQRDVTAVRFRDQHWNYGLLEWKTRQLAVYLRQQGVGPDTLVAICMERSLEMMLAIYGIWRAGGAYVPIDPEYPDDRIAYMLGDAAAVLVLSQAHLRTRVAGLLDGEAKLLVLDEDWPTIEQHVADSAETFSDACVGVGPEHLAYVIYTSGSTGRPKGVMIEHRALVNRIWWMQKRYPLETNDVVLQKTPFSFDVSVWEFAWPMLAGCQLLFAEPGGHKDVDYLQRLIDTAGVTTLHFVPSMINTYLATATAACASVRRIFCSGEALGINAVRHYAQLFPSAELHNLYGPTEAAIDVTAFDCARLNTDFVPIGAPIDNIQIYILDGALQAVPVGVSGELHIAGTGLARGYWNRPELSTEKFIVNPFAPDQRMYKSGDLARWLPDGNIEYGGRIDGQVKLRGFRIEIGEVEVALNQHPGVRESVVTIHGSDENRALIAFYVAVGSEAGTAIEIPQAELLGHLRNSLPEFMLPCRFLALTEIPVTANGKADRKLLATLVPGDTHAARARIAPRNATETTLVQIWAEVLKLAPGTISVHDAFFDLGGNSLLALRMNGLVHECLGKVLPLTALFKAPDIASIARVISDDTLLNEQAVVTIVPRTEVNRDVTAIFAFPGAGGNVMSLQPLSAALGETQPFFALPARPAAPDAGGFDSVETAASHYAAAIRQVQGSGPYRLCGYSNGGVLAFETTRQLLADGASVTQLILLDSVLPEVHATDIIDGTLDVCQFIAAALGKQFQLDRATLVDIPEAERCAFLYPKMRALGFDLSEAQFASYYAAAYASNISCRAYRAQALHQPVPTLLCRIEQCGFDSSEDYEWSRFLPTAPRVIRLPANHYTLLEPSFARQIAEFIRSGVGE